MEAVKTFGKTDRFYFHKAVVICWFLPALLPTSAFLTSHMMNSQDSRTGVEIPYIRKCKYFLDMYINIDEKSLRLASLRCFINCLTFAKHDSKDYHVIHHKAMTSSLSETTPGKNRTDCWVANPWKWVSFMIPMYLCLIINCSVFGMIVRVLIRASKSGSSGTGLGVSSLDYYFQVFGSYI